MKIKCSMLLQSILFLVIAWGYLCDGRKSNRKNLTGSRRRFGYCEGEECHSDASHGTEDTGQEEGMPYPDRRRPTVATRPRPPTSLPSLSSYHHHHPKSDTSLRFNDGQSKGRRFKERNYEELDEDTIEDSVSGPRHGANDGREDNFPPHQYDESEYPRRDVSAIDLPRSPVKNAYSPMDEVPLRPESVMDTSSVPLTNYDHRLPRSLEFDNHHHHQTYDEDYDGVPQIPYRRRNLMHEKDDNSGRGWSASYWKKFSSNDEPNQLLHRPDHVPKVPYDEISEPSNGLDGYLQGIYGGNSMPSSRSPSSLRPSFPLTMDQLPLLDPQPALDKTLMESFLSTNQRLASLLAPESFNSNFNDPSSNQPSTSASSDSSTGSGSGRGASGTSFRSFIPFGFSLSSLFGNSRYSSKGSDNERAGSERDDDNDDEDSHSGSCDSNDSSDSRNSYKILAPPTTTPARRRLQTLQPAPSPFPSSSSTRSRSAASTIIAPSPSTTSKVPTRQVVTLTPASASSVTTSEASKERMSSKMRKRFGVVTRSAAM